MKRRRFAGPVRIARAGPLIALSACLGLLLAMPGTLLAQDRMTVLADETLRRTCPSINCGVIGRFYGGESVLVYEGVPGWSRVSEYYTAGCYDGVSIYVERGSEACTEANGIEDGEFAEWVSNDRLTADPTTMTR